MRILLVTHYFPPEIGAPQARLSELSRYWAEAGEEVTVLTGMPNHPTGVVPDAYRGHLRLEEQVDGYRVLRTWLYPTPNEGIVKKTLGHVSFMVTSVLLGEPRTRPVDVVVVSSPTFFSIFSAWVLARVRRARLVVEIRDLWPAIFVELGVLTNRRLIRLLERLELWAYRTADEVVVVSEGFRDDLVRRGVPGDKVHTIRNGVDLERFTPTAAAPPEARTRVGAGPGDLLVLYIGAHGISHGLGSVLDAAELLAGEPIHVALVGEGAEKEGLLRRRDELGLTNVTMLPGVPRDEVVDLVAAADVCLVPLRDVPLFSTFIPSKIFELFGAGKAVVGAVTGEPASILRDGGAVVVAPEDPAALADAVRALGADPARRAEMGRRGRRFVEEHFDRRALAAAYLEVLQGAVGGSR
jgi:glycosyltransferase involved in cell wall biosynthesis